METTRFNGPRHGRGPSILLSRISPVVMNGSKPDMAVSPIQAPGLLLEPGRLAGEALARSLEATGHFRVSLLVGRVRDLDHVDFNGLAFACVRDEMPDGFGATEGVIRIRTRSDTPIVVRTAEPSDRREGLALALGAAAVVPETAGLDELVEHLERASKGESATDPRAVETALGLLSASRRLPALTRSQRQVAEHARRNATCKTIADELGVSVRTVERVVSDLRSLLGVKPVSEIHERALILGLLRSPNAPQNRALQDEQLTLGLDHGGGVDEWRVLGGRSRPI